MNVLGTTLPQIDVFFEGGVHDQWVNPSDYVCRSFNCPNLPRAIFVGWWNLPLHKVAAFYETPDCTYRLGYYTINTGSTRTQRNGMQYVLSNSRRIRSMMLGRNEAALLQERIKATSRDSGRKRNPAELYLRDPVEKR
ncbi:Hypothetical protein PHPALM_18012 [Phytophthora palmivora]|uniref:Uncharacterized protein n=1 Tax=Phytophthora palmivora TaxID=4796 RepID=A0A2P4XKT6_9STRA|nr:Hypothetical protein PHPALM_18012 [Phytophthora palmivora]